MIKIQKILATVLVLTSLVACDLGPNGLGTAPQGASQQAYEAQVAAQRKSRSDFYRGPRGGATGR